MLRRTLLTTLLTSLSLAVSVPALAKDPKELVIGTSAGPYADQVKLGIKPVLEKQGYKVKVVEFNDYIQPNFALAEGSLDANAFQHIIYLTKFSTENKLPLSELIKVPTAPIAIYSKKHTSLNQVKEGTTVALPNDPTNQARALVLLDQLGWIKLRANFDPIRASEKDIADNIKKIKLIPLEAAQLPRSLQDTDYSFVNGNFALASGLKLSEALAREKSLPIIKTWSRSALQIKAKPG
jgi:D-methionine transport system substrate-binding protein